MTDIPVDLEAFKRFEVASWSEIAKPEAYDSFFGPVTNRGIEPILDAARVGVGTRVLDLATGPGYVAAAAARRGARPLGIDISAPMLALATRLHPSLEFAAADAEALPFADASFEAVVAAFLFLHLARPERAMDEVARVLAPGGWAAATVWGPQDRAQLFGLITEALQAAGAPVPADLPAGPAFFRFANVAEFSGLLSGAGLESVSVHSLEFNHRLTSVDELWRGMGAAGVRTTALLRGQSEEMRQRIRVELNHVVAPFERSGGLEIPVAITLACGRRPG
jgi:SAM-dependent methyltransferase